MINRKLKKRISDLEEKLQNQNEINHKVLYLLELHREELKHIKLNYICYHDN